VWQKSQLPNGGGTKSTSKLPPDPPRTAPMTGDIKEMILGEIKKVCAFNEFPFANTKFFL
jgi:hypothetical protein